MTTSRGITLDEAMTAARNAFRDTARLIRLLTVIGQPSDPDGLVDDTLAVLTDMFTCDVACVMNLVRDRLVVTQACGLAESHGAFVEGWPATEAARRALRSGEVVVADVTPGEPLGGCGLDLRSSVWVPLAADGEPRELLALFRSEEPFTSSDIPILDSVAYRLRMAVRERERGTVMERLAQFGHRLAVHLDPEPLFTEAVRSLRALTGAEDAWVVTVSDGEAELRAYAGTPPPGEWPRPVGRLPGWATVSQGTVCHSDGADEFADADRGTGAGTPPAKPKLCVPVTHDGKPVAMLCATRNRWRPFTQETREIAALFASYLGAAMVNAELYRALRASERSLRLITDSISDMICVLDANHSLVYASPSHERELNLVPASLLGEAITDLVHPADRDRLLEALHRARQALGEVVRVEYRMRARGRWAWVESALRPAETPDTTVVVSSRVVDERKRLEDELRRRATHDPLTGLANRVLARQRLDHALGGDRRVGLLFCDLDKFKEVNDRLGHEAGDDLLVRVAERLQGCVRSGDLLARFGGDEFVVVLGDVANVAEVAEIGRRVLRALGEPFSLGGELVRVSVSVGGVIGKPGATSASALLRDADAAMYAAKDQGPGMIEVFDPPRD